MTELAARLRTPSPRTARRGLVIGYCLALGLLLVVSWYGYREGARTGQARAAVTHTLLVLQHALELENATIAMEASHRGFLVAGDPGFEARRDQHLRTAESEARDVARLVADNPVQTERIRKVVAALAARAALMQETSRLAATDGIAAARLNFRGEGEGSIDPVRRMLRALRAEENALLEVRNRTSSQNAVRLDQVLLYGTGLAFLLLVAAGLLLLRQLVRTEQVGARLAESAERLEFTYAASHIGAWDLALDSGALHPDPRACSVFGRGVEDAAWTYDGLLAAVHPQDRDELDASIQAAKHSGESWSRECRIRGADGRVRWIWISGRAWRAQDDKPGQMLGTVTDISERKRTEEELGNLFSASRDMICICTFDGRFLRVNPAWTRTLGFEQDALVGRPFLEFVHPEDVAATQAESAALGQGNETVLFENRYRTVDGQWRWLLWNATPSPENQLIYAVARDITQRKQDERRIALLNQELTERSQALEESNRELEAFSYSVSHDLRAPLRHIDGYARMLLEDMGQDLAPEPLRYLGTITDSARRMGHLIDDLLALSRLGRKTVVRQVVDMSALVAEVLAELGPTEAEVSVGALPPASGDRSLLKQVWINLISNALKYSAPRGGKALVRISGEPLDGGGGAYSVADNGVGFDMRYAGKLFGVFQRLHPQDQFEGTGVGLAITQRIVSRHGGRIAALAEPDRGASFRFEIPEQEVPE